MWVFCCIVFLYICIFLTQPLSLICVAPPVFSFLDRRQRRSKLPSSPPVWWMHSGLLFDIFRTLDSSHRDQSQWSPEHRVSDGDYQHILDGCTLQTAFQVKLLFISQYNHIHHTGCKYLPWPTTRQLSIHGRSIIPMSAARNRPTSDCNITIVLTGGFRAEKNGPSFFNFCGCG